MQGILDLQETEEIPPKHVLEVQVQLSSVSLQVKLLRAQVQRAPAVK